MCSVFLTSDHNAKMTDKMRLYLILLVNSLTLISAENTGFFWHVTDMHWDPTYLEGNNKGALSCNKGSGQDGDWGQWGDFDCDAPWTLVNSSIYAMKKIHPDPDFLIWTGDDTPHIWDDEVLDKDNVRTIIFNMTDKLLEVWPNKAIYSALGNHDWHPKNQLPPNNDPFYNEIADKWSSWLTTPDANNTFRKGGYYALQHEQLKILVLNTNLYYKSNDQTQDMPDPANQFQWLDDELRQCQSDGQKAMIVAHVPPGMFEKHMNYSWFYPFYNKMFIHLETKYKDVIGSVHMAHHHTDTFRLVKDSAGNAVSSILLAPAVAPWETTLPGVMGGTGNNPGIRLVMYDKVTGQVLNILQYYLNLKEANENGRDNWELLYNATKYYNLPDMSTDSLTKLAKNLADDEVMFTKYYDGNGVRYDPDEKWNEEIRKVHLCAIEEVDYDKYNECMNNDVNAAYSVTYSRLALLMNSVIMMYIMVF